ncbi:hypothetical protein [Flavobacterium sp. KMS]|nr:hypothetical protein [Flavobacterium sp. KMS]
MSVGFSTSITGGYTQGSGNVNSTNKKEDGNPKSFSETVANYSKLLSPFN